MYIHKRRVRDNVPADLRRATAPRIEQAAQQIRAHESSTGVELGEITRQHLTVLQARQPEGTEFTVPSDNTTRQAQELDAIRREASQEQDTTINGRSVKRIRIHLNGTWVGLDVDIVSLRTALGLPEHDIFRDGIFHEYRHNETVGEDVQDTDHGAPPLVAQQQNNEQHEQDVANTKNGKKRR